VPLPSLQQPAQHAAARARLASGQQTIYRCPVNRHILAFGHCQDEYDQHIIVDLVNQPVALPEQLDLVAVAQIAMKFGPGQAGLLQSLPQEFLEYLLDAAIQRVPLGEGPGQKLQAVARG